jgi:hypothetical protein
MAEPQPAFQGRDRTPHPGPETLCSTPTRYPFKLKDGCPLGLQFFADVRLGRSRQNSIWFVGDVFGRLKQPRKPSGRSQAKVGPRQQFPIKSADSRRAQRRPPGSQLMVSGRRLMWASPRRMPVSPSGLTAAGAKIISAPAPPPGARDRTLCVGATCNTPPAPA